MYPPTDQQLLTSAIANRNRYSLTLGTHTAHDGDDLKWVYTGTPVLNTIFAPQLAADRAEATIKDAIDQFRQRGVTPAIILSPLSQPTDLGDRLQKWGYVKAFDFQGMYLDLSQLNASTMPPTGFELREITTPAALALWTDTCCKGFKIPADLHEVFGRIMIQSATLDPENAPYRHYLGFSESKPVSTICTIPSDGVLGVYWVATTPEARRKGIAAATMTAVLEQARNAGQTHATLQSTAIGYNFYKHLGFQDLYLESVYEWRP